MSAPDVALQPWAGGQSTGGEAASSVTAHRVLLVASAATSAFAVLSAADAGGLRLPWQAMMINAAAAGAMLVVLTSVPGTTGLIHRMRIGSAANALLWMLGVGAITILFATGHRTVPSVADLCFVAFIVPSGWILAGVVRDRLTAAESVAVYLDNALVILASFALLLGLAGPVAFTMSGWLGLLMVAYPALFLGSAVSTLVMMIETRQYVDRSAIAFTLGLALVGIASVNWALSPAGQFDWSGLGPYLVAAGPLVSMYGSITWTGAVNPSPTYATRVRLFGWAVGPIALGVMAIAAIVAEDDRAIEILLHLILAGGSVLLMLRTALHLRERGEMLAEVRRLAAENERLVARLREELAARERVHARLVDASRMSAVGELAAAVAHEVNNPLTGVLGYADLLLSSATPGTSEYDDLSVIRTEALRVRDRVRALLDFATPRRPELVPTNLAELISVPIGLLRYHLERRGITLDDRLTSAPKVAVDPPSIQQVLINVISDVAAAMPSGGRLVVTSGQAGDHVVITIEPIADDLDDDTLAASFRVFGETAVDGARIAASLGVLRGHDATIGLHQPVPGRTVVEIQIPLGPAQDDEVALGAPMITVPS